MLTSVLNIHAYLLVSCIPVIYSNGYHRIMFYVLFEVSSFETNWNRRNDCLAPACIYLAVDLRFFKSTCSCSNCAWMIYKRFKEKCKYQYIILFLVLHMCYENDKCTQYGKKLHDYAIPFLPSKWTFYGFNVYTGI